MERLAKAFNWTTDYLINMPVDSQVSVRDVPVSDKKLLIECTKAYIDVYGGVEFNKDYTKIFKYKENPIIHLIKKK